MFGNEYIWNEMKIGTGIEIKNKKSVCVVYCQHNDSEKNQLIIDL